MVDVLLLDAVDDVQDHIFELYTERAPPESADLGYVDRRRDVVTIALKHAGIDLSIRQSLAELNSTRETSSTGFVCWQAALLFVDWALSDPRCPFKFTADMAVVELGAGVGAVMVSVLGPRVRWYTATDQKHILKLLRSNFATNVVSSHYTTTTIPEATPVATKKKKNAPTSTIEIVEFDWEWLDDGMARYGEVGGPVPDVIVACDTIYNEYLIGHFLAAMKRLMGPHTGAIVTLQLREPDIMELFVVEAKNAALDVYCVPSELLSQQLQAGFVVYYIVPAAP